MVRFITWNSDLSLCMYTCLQRIMYRISSQVYIYKEAAKESAGVRAIRIMQKKNVVMISVPRSVLASVPCRCYAGSKPYIRRGAAL